MRPLLEREDINLMTAGTKYGATPLLWVVDRGHEGVVEVILELEDMTSNSADTKYGRGRFWWGAEWGTREY